MIRRMGAGLFLLATLCGPAGLRSQATVDSDPADTRPDTGEPAPVAPEKPAVVSPTFFQRDCEQRFGRRWLFARPREKGAILYRNSRPLQFFGYAALREKLRPELDAPLPLPEERVALGALLRAVGGDFVVLFVSPPASEEEAEEPEAAPPAATGTEDFAVPYIEKDSKKYFLINLRARPDSGIDVELEEDAGRVQPGRYLRCVVDEIELQ